VPADGNRYLVVDATGVGRPVIDLLYVMQLPCKIWPVTITAGASEGYSGDGFRVPKRDLVTGLLLMIQNEELNIAAGMKDGETFRKELAPMRVSMTAGGREKRRFGSTTIWCCRWRWRCGGCRR
jgi:hypothetical protein